MSCRVGLAKAYRTKSLAISHLSLVGYRQDTLENERHVP